MKDAATHFKLLTENAIDFLRSALDEFPTKPKYSIIHFYSAVELFLKARLMHEHWSLVVSGREADWTKFQAGDFASVTFEEAHLRLNKIVRSPLRDTARINFDTIRKHRNRMVHFFHNTTSFDDATTADLAKEQLRAWCDLNYLLLTQWHPIFVPYTHALSTIEGKLTVHRGYLRVKFEHVTPKIEKLKRSGRTITICHVCNFPASLEETILDDLKEEKCLVCIYKRKWLNFSCPICENIGQLEEGGVFACKNCGSVTDEQKIFESVDQFVASTDNYFEAPVPAFCYSCQTSDSVAQYGDKYLCTFCLELTDSTYACGFCGGLSNHYDEDSYLTGCAMCDGSIGWEMGKND